MVGGVIPPCSSLDGPRALVTAVRACTGFGCVLNQASCVAENFGGLVDWLAIGTTKKRSDSTTEYRSMGIATLRMRIYPPSSPTPHTHAMVV